MAENKEINNLHGEYKGNLPAMEAAVEDFVIIENVLLQVCSCSFKKIEKWVMNIFLLGPGSILKLWRLEAQPKVAK